MIVASACSASSDIEGAGVALDPAVDDERQSVPGYTRHAIDASRASIAVPEDWMHIESRDDLDALLTEGVAAEDLRIDPAAVSAVVEPGGFFAVGESGANVSALAVPADEVPNDVAAYVEAAEAQFVASGFDAVDVTGSTSSVDGREGLDVRGSYRLFDQEVRAIQSVVFDDDTAYVITVTTFSTRTDALADDIISTFDIAD
ncbi:MAG: hypothetical protein OEU32_08445 [Acidimicrobiia bacterium]|nr:hypothetical protein [Acidimicrobiia bacterium]